EKQFCEWNLFYFTHPHKTWMTYQQVLAEPTWFAHYMSQIPDDIKLDRTKLLAFSCLPKGQLCTVEIRNVRLVRDRIRVDKPYLTNPIGWPSRADGDGRTVTPYFVRNVSKKPVSVSAVVKSKHTA